MRAGLTHPASQARWGRTAARVLSCLPACPRRFHNLSSTKTHILPYDCKADRMGPCCSPRPPPASPSQSEAGSCAGESCCSPRKSEDSCTQGCCSSSTPTRPTEPVTRASEDSCADGCCSKAAAACSAGPAEAPAPPRQSVDNDSCTAGCCETTEPAPVEKCARDACCTGAAPSAKGKKTACCDGEPDLTQNWLHNLT